MEGKRRRRLFTDYFALFPDFDFYPIFGFQDHAEFFIAHLSAQDNLFLSQAPYETGFLLDSNKGTRKLHTRTRRSIPSTLSASARSAAPNALFWQTPCRPNFFHFFLNRWLFYLSYSRVCARARVCVRFSLCVLIRPDALLTLHLRTLSFSRPFSPSLSLFFSWS